MGPQQRQPLATIPGENLPCSGHIDCSVCSMKFFISCQDKGHIVVVWKADDRGTDSKNVFAKGQRLAVKTLILSNYSSTKHTDVLNSPEDSLNPEDVFKNEMASVSKEQTEPEENDRQLTNNSRVSVEFETGGTAAEDELLKEKHRRYGPFVNSGNSSTSTSSASKTKQQGNKESVMRRSQGTMKAITRPIKRKRQVGQKHQVQTKYKKQNAAPSFSPCEAKNELGNDGSPMKNEIRGASALLCNMSSLYVLEHANEIVQTKTPESVPPYYHCELCNSNVREMKLFDKHLVNHMTPKPFECEICGKRSRTAYVAKLHKESVHNKEGPKEHVCEVCGKAFRFKTRLDRHKEVHLTVKPYACHLCDASFNHYSNLKRHIGQHSGEKKYGCEYCGKRFFQKVTKEAHVRIHTGECPFKCDICGKGFKQARLLRNHLANHARKNSVNVVGDKSTCSRAVSHPVRKQVPCVCELCGKVLSSKGNLNVHNRTVHEKVYSWQCGVCSKQFSTKQQLQKHSRVHTGEKPFSCSVCGKEFSSRANCGRHLLVHTGEKPHICETCGKAFGQKSQLKNHLLTHKNYENVPEITNTRMMLSINPVVEEGELAGDSTLQMTTGCQQSAVLKVGIKYQ